MPVGAAGVPARITLEREVLVGGDNWEPDGVEWRFVASEVPDLDDWPAPDPATGVGVQLSDLTDTGELLRDIQVTFSATNGAGRRVRLGASWPVGAQQRTREITPEFPSGTNRRWSSPLSTDAHWYTFEAELLHAVEDTSAGGVTNGEGVWVAFSGQDILPQFYFPPVVTAEISGSGSRCALSQATASADVLEASRWVRDSLLQGSALGRRYIYAYEHLSGEVSALMAKNPRVRSAILRVAQQMLEVGAGGEPSQLQKLRLGLVAAEAVRLLRDNGSAELRSSLDQGLRRLPVLLNELDWGKLKSREARTRLAKGAHAHD